MDDLAALLEDTFKVSNDLYATSGVHPRFSQYKSRTSGPSDQEVRRKRILEQQKQSRYDYQNHVRQLAQGRFSDMETESKPQTRNFYRGGKGYRDQLMMSEWMVEVPEDLAENWVMVPCPVGKRALVIAAYGQTSSWSKGGWLINKFESLLPGGSKRVARWNRDSTVLDCIYCELTKTYYVIDMMCWKEQPQYDCETEFRFYWMATKFSEMPELKEITKINKFRFDPLPNYSCLPDNISNVLHTKMNVQIDGLLFFHKRTHYTLGSTPLVTWLKPYMVPDILGVQVGAEHMRYKPMTYTTFSAHLEQVKIDQKKAEEKEKARQERRRERRRSNQSMDTTPNQNPEKHVTAQGKKPAPSQPDSVVDSRLTESGGDDVTDDVTEADVLVEEEEELVDDTTEAGEETATSLPVVPVAPGETPEAQPLDVGQWNPSGNANPFSDEISEHEQVTMEGSESDDESPEHESTAVPGIIRLPKNTKVASPEVGGAAAADEQGDKRDKVKAKKLRGRKVKGRNT